LKQFLHPEVIVAFEEGYYIKGPDFSVPYIAQLGIIVLGGGRGGNVIYSRCCRSSKD
jgi:hypothetical protein